MIYLMIFMVAEYQIFASEQVVVYKHPVCERMPPTNVVKDNTNTRIICIDARRATVDPIFKGGFECDLNTSGI